MLILGIDPGTATTGWGLVSTKHSRQSAPPAKAPQGRAGTSNKPVLRRSSASEGGRLALVDYGCIVTSKSDEMPQRLLTLRKELKKLVKGKDIDALVCEKHFFGTGRRTATAITQAKGVIMATSAEVRLPFFEYQGLSVKLGLTGSGRADKKLVQRAVAKYLGKRKLKKPVDGYLDDAADALAVAIYHLLHMSS